MPTFKQFKKYFYQNTDLGISVDISRLHFDDDFWEKMNEPLQNAFEENRQLEAGAIANPDENRMVGHYWLRAPQLAPQSLGAAISKNIETIKDFTAMIHSGAIKPQTSQQFTHFLSVGIGGSALGPEFVSKALGHPHSDKMTPHFFDNTDPDGMERTLAEIGDHLPQTLVLVISKSGGTQETHNGMIRASQAFEDAGLDFAKHAVAITGAGSKLDQTASNQNWLRRFPMWDWVGGRTSELSAVGLLPAALQGFDIDAMLSGAAAMDEATRTDKTNQNPAALLSAAWFHATNGKGQKDMVVLPYSDRLEMFSRYLQQLVMESLGKEKDRSGNVVHQGITVYGNKGSTDQHAYVQQLRDGIPNFFVTFIEVLQKQQNSNKPAHNISKNVTIGDYLHGFLYGTRDALWEKDRESITISLRRCDAEFIGKLIALFERTVTFYGSLVNVNAYHQPGVEAGKKAAQGVIDLQEKVLLLLSENKESPFDAQEIAREIHHKDAEMIFHLLTHLEANGRITRTSGSGVDAKYGT